MFTCQRSFEYVYCQRQVSAHSGLAHSGNDRPSPLTTTTRTLQSAVGVFLPPRASRGRGRHTHGMAWSASPRLGTQGESWLNPPVPKCPQDRDGSHSPSAAGHDAHLPAAAGTPITDEGGKGQRKPEIQRPCEQYLVKTWETTQWNKLILSPNPQIIHPKLKAMNGPSLRNTLISIPLSE